MTAHFSLRDGGSVWQPADTLRSHRQAAAILAGARCHLSGGVSGKSRVDRIFGEHHRNTEKGTACLSAVRSAGKMNQVEPEIASVVVALSLSTLVPAVISVVRKVVSAWFLRKGGDLRVSANGIELTLSASHPEQQALLIAQWLERLEQRDDDRR